MATIVVLDTSVNDTNLGNGIIMEAVCHTLRLLFPEYSLLHVAALEYMCASRRLVEEADFVFLGGTNLLSSRMKKTSEWRLRCLDTTWLQGVVLLGVGWWQYERRVASLYTRFLLHRVLSRQYSHSVRDSYTMRRLQTLGYRVLNTGCPSLWTLTQSHCRGIPQKKSESAVLTFTEYNQRVEDDAFLFEVVRSSYRQLYFWPQQPGDVTYARRLCGQSIRLISPTIEALDQVLRTEEVDYVGTRLHAGIRALQWKRRAVIVGVDNRGIEMGHDFNLPVVRRDRLQMELLARVNGVWETDVRLDEGAILLWKQQFEQGRFGKSGRSAVAV